MSIKYKQTIVKEFTKVIKKTKLATFWESNFSCRKLNEMQLHKTSARKTEIFRNSSWKRKFTKLKKGANLYSVVAGRLGH